METISVRVPDAVEEELDAYAEAENLDRDAAIRKLLVDRLEEVRHKRALSMLEAGEASSAKAAEIADLDRWAFAELARSEDVSWVAEDHLASDLEEL
ncbi:UPF0175 family protein [Halomicrobium salinisoli]|uniref:UPF0175 family protein n=1 Tax=Halomicrobium salinisoli TaxID=2878391 RepID=UPI001CF09897|nr:DUF6290 family protein [Halomicrobium salinisoli]